MVRYVVAAALALALASPANALAGGFATVGLGSLPDGVVPGEPWNAELTILQHGRTPLEGVRPQVIVSNASGDERREFAARATGRPGVYRAKVVFPAAGTWNYAVDDGFSARHSFPPVRVGGHAAVSAAAARAPEREGPNLPMAFAAATVAGLVAGLSSSALVRRGLLSASA